MPFYDEYRARKRKRRLLRTLYDLPAARRTLPLLRRITADIVAQRARLAHHELLAKRLARAGSDRWPQRQTRYWLQDELRRLRANLAQTAGELEGLGIVLLDGVRGVTGFPTIVNGSLAFLVFRLEDDDVRYWRYRDQAKLRPIPDAWDAGWNPPLDRSETARRRRQKA